MVRVVAVKLLSSVVVLVVTALDGRIYGAIIVVLLFLLRLYI